MCQLFLKKNVRISIFFEKQAFFLAPLTENWYNQWIFCNFASQMRYSINIHNQLLDLSLPCIMAIVNITPDSFYTSLGDVNENVLFDYVQTILNQGANIIDIGACSTRPEAIPVDAAEEWKRLSCVLPFIRAKFPHAILSVDTFRADVAEKAILAGVDIINDVSGGNVDAHMWDIVAKYKIPYILTYSQDSSIQKSGYNYMSDVLDFFQDKLDKLHQKGIIDVIIDPGFGFAKTEGQNYALLQQLGRLSVLHSPILVGVSRKSMLYKPLGMSPSDVLSATVAANTIALERGAKILRVHDVEAAKQAIMVYSLTHKID